MKKTIIKISITAFVLLILISVGMLFTLGAGDKEATEKETAEIKSALAKHLELRYISTSDLRKKMLTLESIPKEDKEKARKKLYQDLIEVTTEDYAKEWAEKVIGGIDCLEQEYGERKIDGSEKVLAIEDIEYESQDKATVVAIVWWGEKIGKFNPSTKRTEPFYAKDFTTVNRYPMQKIDGKWKVSGAGVTVKGVPMDDDLEKYGPPTPEEAKKMFENASFNWEEKAR
ncbi:MAG: hypothetical protein AB1743_04405 [Actinomycetota bacterium]